MPLAAVIASRDPGQRVAMIAALGELAEQDPLINVRQDDVRREVSLSLYGVVQQEVIAANLERGYGIEVEFHEPTPICIERVVGTASSVEALGEEGNPFPAGIAFRVEPLPPGAGVQVRVSADIRSIPIYVYKSTAHFASAIDQYVRATLDEGLAGWQVKDCAVTLTHCDYTAPATTARDYRLLTPLVLMRALHTAGTVICEPYLEVRIETPAQSAAAVLGALSRLRASAPVVEQGDDRAIVRSRIPAIELSTLQRQVPGLTSGEGILESEFADYEPITGAAPKRARRTVSPLNRGEYLMHLAGRARATSK